MPEPLRILMLEDSASDAEIVQRILKKEKMHCQFSLAVNKETYLQALDRGMPDIILSDHSLPQFNSLEALTLARRRFPDIPFIMVTGAVSEEFAADIIKSGADDYILKDRLNRLPAAIDAVLRQRKAEMEKKRAEQKIMQSETNLRTIFENTSEGFLLLNRDGIVKVVNSKAGEYVFFSKKGSIQAGESIYNFIEEERIDSFKAILSGVLEGDSVQYDRSYEMGNGNTSWLDFSVTPVREDGAIKGVCITGRDITPRKKAEEEVKKNLIEKEALAERMSVILNTLPANIALLDNEGYIVEVNDAWKKFADENGFTGNNYCVGYNYVDISKNSYGLDEADGKKVARGINAVLKNKVKEFVIEYPCHSLTEKRWFRMVATPLENKEYSGAVVMHVEISELLRLEQERLESKMVEQKKIARAMVQAQEKVRNAIGTELHDNVNQILVGTNLVLGMIKDQPEKTGKFIQSCIDNINNAIGENRKIAHELVMPNPEIESFIPQISRLNQTMLVTAGIKPTINQKNFNETLLSDDQKLAIYRVAQEQCTNIVKYSKAKNVEFLLSTADNLFTMQITDDGQGAATDKISKGIGLRNITGRIVVFGGITTIDTQPGKGFVLNIKIPL